MAEEVYITAAPGSRRFDKVVDLVDQDVTVAERGITGYRIVATLDGVERSQSLGDYEKQKFPGTKQEPMVRFSVDDGKFLIQKSNGEFWDQNDANAAVKELVLFYPNTHPLKGQQITRANIHDSGDAFFNHSDFRPSLYEGELTLRPKSPGDTASVVEDMLRGHPAFMDEAVSEVRSADVEFIIRNPKVTQDRENRDRNHAELAFELYTGMKTDPDRMRQILVLFQIDADETLPVDALRNMIFDKSRDITGSTQGLPTQQLFIKYAELPKDILKLQSTVGLGILRGVVERRAGIYYFEGNSIGQTFDSVVDFFKDSKPHREVLTLRIDSSK